MVRFSINRRSFVYQLISFVVITLALIYFAITAVIYSVITEITLKNTKNYLGTLVDERITQLEGRLKNIAIQGKVLSSILENHLMDGRTLDSYLTSLLNDNPDLVSACIVPCPGTDSKLQAENYLTDGMGNLQIIPLSDINYTVFDWYQLAILTNRREWGEPWFDTIGTNQYLCSYSIPIHTDGDITGVLRLDSAVHQLKGLELPAKVKTSGYSFIISDTGTIISHPADSLVMNYSIFNLSDEYGDDTLWEIAMKMIKGKKGMYKNKSCSFFKNQWLTFAQVPSNHWTFAIVCDNSFVFADRRVLSDLNLIIASLGFLAISAVLYLRTIRITRPLKEITRVATEIGAGNFDIKIQDTSKIYETNQLSATIAQMRDSLKEYIANLKNITQEKEKIQAEVMFASDVQRSLVPQNEVSITLSGRISFHGILLPAGAVGGDLYDYFMIDEDHCCFTIADVVDKGIVAAMTMTMATTLIRTVATPAKSPSHILTELNSFLCKNELESNMLTIMLGIIDLRDGTLTYSNCGHLAWYQRKKDGSVIKHSQTHSNPLGVFPQLTIDSTLLYLDAKDQLILVTDGVTETMNDAGEYFGYLGVEKVLASLKDSSVGAVANLLHNSVNDFASESFIRDDLTILVVELGRLGAHGGSELG